MVKLPDVKRWPEPSVSRLPVRLRFANRSEAMVNLGRWGLYSSQKTPVAAAIAAARMKRTIRNHMKQQQKETQGRLWVTGMRFLWADLGRYWRTFGSWMGSCFGAWRCVLVEDGGGGMVGGGLGVVWSGGGGGSEWESVDIFGGGGWEMMEMERRGFQS